MFPDVPDRDASPADDSTLPVDDGTGTNTIAALRRSLARMAWCTEPTITLSYASGADVLTARFLPLPARREQYVSDRLCVQLDGTDDQALPTALAFTGFLHGGPSPADRTLRALLGDAVRLRADELAREGDGATDVPLDGGDCQGRLAAWRAFARRPCYALGLEIVPGELRAAVVDGRGTVVERQNRPLAFMSPRAVVETIEELVVDLHDLLGDEPVIGVGIGGPVDRRTGVVHSYTKGAGRHQTAWVDAPLGDLVAGALGRRTVVLNDVDALATHERWFGLGMALSRYAVSLVDEGVGGTLVVDGEIDTQWPMELGNIVIHPDGRKCRCGNRGCVEATAGMWAIVEQVDERVEASVTDLEEAIELAERFHDHDSTAAEAVFHAAGQDLAVAVGSVQALVNPETWAIYLPPGLDGTSNAGQRFLFGLGEFQRWVSFKPYGNCELFFRTSADQNCVHGAALAALEQLGSATA